MRGFRPFLGERLAAPVSNDELISLVRKSELVDEPRLAHCLQQLDPEVLAGEPARLAEALVAHGLLTSFQAEQMLQGKCRGFNIGPYKILERLGSGGMALVYLCDDPERQRRVAIKVLPNTRAQDLEYLKRFYREARVAAALDNPHIVRTFDIDHDGRVNFQVMEYVDGSLLHDIVQKFGPLSIPRACDYIRQAAQGLQHAHEASLVHRDIKPGNLILDRSGTVRILDMGLARVSTDESEEVITRGIIGTPDYLAPEQAQDSHNVDIRADIYALGCTFYYLLTGGPPFPEGSVAQKLLWHQTRVPTPLRAFRPEVPEALAAVVHKMLAKNRDNRFQTPVEIVEALEPWTQVPVPPPSEEEMPELSPAARASGNTVPDLVAETPAVPVRAKPKPPTVPPPVPPAAASRPAPPASIPRPAPPRQRSPEVPQPRETAAPAGGKVNPFLKGKVRQSTPARIASTTQKVSTRATHAGEAGARSPVSNQGQLKEAVESQGESAESRAMWIVALAVFLLGAAVLAGVLGWVYLR
jgi:serine/threonine protein kinase